MGRNTEMLIRATARQKHVLDKDWKETVTPPSQGPCTLCHSIRSNSPGGTRPPEYSKTWNQSVHCKHWAPSFFWKQRGKQEEEDKITLKRKKKKTPKTCKHPLEKPIISHYPTPNLVVITNHSSLSFLPPLRSLFLSFISSFPSIYLLFPSLSYFPKGTFIFCLRSKQTNKT